ncbi:MAG: DUF5597 domain-containing protein [Rikenellaceae bacterium]|nr:DUF5597 domain-containing protein [Rikenellaceae bacterium]
MKNLFITTLLAGSLCLLAGCGAPEKPAATAPAPGEIPHLEKRGETTQLIVHGKPHLVLGGELRNSTSSHKDYLLPKLEIARQGGLNTVLAVITWEQIEPQEGVFDFTTVDDLVQGARENDLKLVILWFGSWKNGITSYVPQWVKNDQKRFPLIETKEGHRLPILSTVVEQNWKADAKAYAAMMRHLKEIDGTENTVVMIQVENEVGLHGDTRDYLPAAVELFNAPVPEQLMSYLVEHKESLLPELRKAWDAAGGRTSGTWNEVFGKGDYTDELFMAWNYSRYLNEVAAAGKAEYALPTFVNAWIVQPEDRHPGDYPSGGPQAQNHDIWRAGAPNIDILSPDIYLSDFPGILDMYSRGGNPVFVPESKAYAGGAANATYALAERHAIGYSPFAIEHYLDDPENNPLSQLYRALGTFTDRIAAHQAAGTIRGAWLKAENPVRPKQTVSLGDYDVEFSLITVKQSGAVNLVGYQTTEGYGLIMQEGPGEYIVMGSNVQVVFRPKDGSLAGLAKVEEGWFEADGQWHGQRWLNGDEVQLRYDLKKAESEGLSGAGLRFRGITPAFQRVWLYNYR